MGTNRMSSSQAEDEEGLRSSGTTPTAMIFTTYSMTIQLAPRTDATTL